MDEALVAAPPGVLERDYVLAQALRALKPGGRLVALAPKDRGGARLRRTLEGFGCTVEEEARRHHRICAVVRPTKPEGLAEAVAAGAPRLDPALGLWTQPGVFSWDRVDAGTRLLMDHLPPLAGRGADLGCGLGVLAHNVLGSAAVAELTLIDIDRRAVEAARRNVVDPRAEAAWADARGHGLTDLHFVVANPPFHEGGREDRNLGVAFIQAAAKALRRGGVFWLVANVGLPYEATMKAAFAQTTLRAQGGGYKVIEARK